MLVLSQTTDVPMWLYVMLTCKSAPLLCHGVRGAGLVQDTQAAIEWYEFAAEGGLAAAQNNLGQLLLQRHNRSRADTAAAIDWLQAAAEQGSAAALYNLGVCHELGLSGQGPDVAAAQACYQQAGGGKALLRLGRLYLQQQQGAAARAAFKAAAEAGSAEALLQLAKLQSGSWAHSGKQQQQQQLLPFDLAASLGAGSSFGASARSSSTASMGVSSGKGSSKSSSGGSFGAASGAYSTCSSLAAQATAEATH